MSERHASPERFEPNGRPPARSGLVMLIAWVVFGAFVAGYYTGKQLARSDNVHAAAVRAGND